MLVFWPFPDPGQYALNVDGCSFGNPGIAGYGGLIRDDEGNWIRGFSGHVEFTDSLHVELLAILQGLLVAWEIEEIKNVSVRSDCKIALSLITDATPHPHPYSQIIDQIKEVISRDWIISFVYTQRESNQCADHMAKIGAYGIKCMGVLGIFSVPPTGLYSLLKSDAEKSPYTPGHSMLSML